MEKQPVAVLLSGGLDSTVAAHWSAAHHHLAMCLSFDYGSKHAVRELDCAKKQAALLNVSHHIINISPIAEHLKSSLLKTGGDIPEGNYDESNMKSTVVPFRNGIFLSIAAGIAESNGTTGLVIAAHSGDHTIYPDCREEFMQAMSRAIEQGTYAGIKIIRPFISFDKSDIVRLGHELGVDFSQTYSCYKGGEIHCGNCATCLERKQSFHCAGVADPTSYLK